MPTLCDNYLTIWCEPAEKMQEIVRGTCPPTSSFVRRMLRRVLGKGDLRSETGFLEFLWPPPDDLESLQFEPIPQLAHMPKSYHWRLKN